MLKIGKFYIIRQEEYPSLEDVFVIAPKFRELIEQTHGKALSLKSKAGVLEEKSVLKVKQADALMIQSTNLIIQATDTMKEAVRLESSVARARKLAGGRDAQKS